jgi:hypothetical protein
LFSPKLSKLLSQSDPEIVTRGYAIKDVGCVTFPLAYAGCSCGVFPGVKNPFAGTRPSTGATVGNPFVAFIVLDLDSCTKQNSVLIHTTVVFVKIKYPTTTRSNHGWMNDLIKE